MAETKTPLYGFKMMGDVAQYDRWEHPYDESGILGAQISPSSYPVLKSPSIVKETVTPITSELAAKCTCGVKFCETRLHRYKCTLVPKCTVCGGRTDMQNGEGHKSLRCKGIDQDKKMNPLTRQALSYINTKTTLDEMIRKITSDVHNGKS